MGVNPFFVSAKVRSTAFRRLFTNRFVVPPLGGYSQKFVVPPLGGYSQKFVVPPLGGYSHRNFPMPDRLKAVLQT